MTASTTKRRAQRRLSTGGRAREGSGVTVASGSVIVGVYAFARAGSPSA